MSTQTSPLTYILTSAKFDATIQRWVASLTNYHFQLHYKTGRTNLDEDALSRIPRDCNLDSETVKAIINITKSDEAPTFEVYVGSAMQLHQVDIKTYPTTMTL